MQLGELQSQFERFTRRGVSVVALSVDPVEHSDAMIRRMKLQFPVVSDQDQAVMQAYGVQNPDTRELALHAVYIVDKQRRVLYRKVASRRPLAQELLDAIDYYNDVYPLGDSAVARDDLQVAFPHNYFQALLEIVNRSDLPASIKPELLQATVNLIRQGELDAAIFSYRRFLEASDYSEAELLSAAGWLSKTAMDLDSDAVQLGTTLNDLLNRLRSIRQSNEPDNRQLADIQGELDVVRTAIRNNAGKWRLNRIKTTLRSYRELSLASLRN